MFNKLSGWQTATIMADIFFQRTTETNVVAIISCMEDQVKYLNKLGLSTVSVSDQHND